MRHVTAFELLPLYSLDALEPEDQRAVESHSSECRRCLAELGRYSAVADALSGEIEPSAQVWSRILHHIDSP